MDGLEVLHEIRSDERMAHVPVVMVSSSSRADDIEKSYDSGANGYLVKRFDGSSPGGFLAEAARYWVELNEVVQ
jgi:two-component system response regulator